MESGNLAQLVEAIEAGQTVQLQLPSAYEAAQLVANVRNRIYRARRKLQSICDAEFDPFSFKIEPVSVKANSKGEIEHVVTFSLRIDVRQPMYEWKVLP